MSFIGDLTESKMFPTVQVADKVPFLKIVERLYLYVCAINVLVNEEETVEFTKQYIRKSMQFSDFRRWRNGGNDLYVLLWKVLYEDDTDPEDHPNRLPLKEKLLILWLKNRFASITNDGLTKQLFTHMDYGMKITETPLRSIRRLVMEWPDLDEEEKSLALTRMLQIFRARMPRSELLPQLEKIARQQDLEIKNAHNKEIEDKNHNKPLVVITNKPKEKETGFLSGLAAFGIGGLFGSWLGK